MATSWIVQSVRHENCYYTTGNLFPSRTLSRYSNKRKGKGTHCYYNLGLREISIRACVWLDQVITMSPGFHLTEYCLSLLSFTLHGSSWHTVGKRTRASDSSPLSNSERDIFSTRSFRYPQRWLIGLILRISTPLARVSQEDEMEACLGHHGMGTSGFLKDVMLGDKNNMLTTPSFNMSGTELSSISECC